MRGEPRANLSEDSIDIGHGHTSCAALKDTGLAARPSDESEARAALKRNCRLRVRAKQMEKEIGRMCANKKEWTPFLAANKTKDGNRSLPSGTNTRY